MAHPAAGRSERRLGGATFAREFKKAFGLPPHRYLLTRRIERATALLRDTGPAHYRDRASNRLDQPWHFRAHLP
jgi:AraC-like DNA-binding protein